ncbi:MAG: hypothetical protein ONB24_01535 [candidate division KSB1 bacterium]|nr:hypothetical protein [candidate division KSB1 bacterium]
MSKTFQVGDEVQALCGKCKSATIHIIEVINEQKIKRVLCRSCNTSHRYLPVGKEEKPKKSTKTAAKKEIDPAVKMSRKWSRLMAKSETETPVSYQMNKKYMVNEVIHHDKFGDGVVVNIIDANKISVVFEDGPKTLIQNRG